MVTKWGEPNTGIPRTKALCVDLTIQGTERWNLGSHLHKLRPLPDPNGNRAERRAAKKKAKKK